jgi:hypothetical protein
VKTVATTGEGIDKLLEAIHSAPPRTRTAAVHRVLLRLTNLQEAIAKFQSVGASIQPGPEGRVVIEPPPGVFLELVEGPGE